MPDLTTAQKDTLHRQNIMKQYIVAVTKKKNPPKTKLTMANWASIASLGIIPEEFKPIARLVNYKTYVFQPQNRDAELSGDSKTNGWYRLDRIAQNFFENNLQSCLSPLLDYKYEDDGSVILSQKSFSKYLNEQLVPVKQWLNQPETLDKYNKAMWNEFAQNVWAASCTGSISKWEMDAMSFYYHEHELAHVDPAVYHLTPWTELPPEPVVMGYSKGNSPQYQLFTIVGTVLDKNSTRHMVTLLTPDGVATIKFYGAMFADYDKQISAADPEHKNKKKIIERSWFSRGNKLIITGFRRGDMFYPRRYSQTTSRPLGLITAVSPDGKHIEITYRRKED